MRTVSVNPTRINQARLSAGMTQADVAHKLREHGHKANERSIRRWESGQHAPHANIVPALADALGISIDSLYEQVSEAEDDDDEDAALKHLAHKLIDRGQTDLAADLLDRISTMRQRRQKALLDRLRDDERGEVMLP